MTKSLTKSKSNARIEAEIAASLAILKLGHNTSAPDDTYFVVAEWSRPARAFVDRQDLGLYKTEGAARDTAGELMVGTTRLIRYTVWQGNVTTRRQLG